MNVQDYDFIGMAANGWISLQTIYAEYKNYKIEIIPQNSNVVTLHRARLVLGWVTVFVDITPQYLNQVT